MCMVAYSLSPVDSWFFRDGRPFNQGEKNQTDVESMFPPFATTIVGAIRASLARSKGWNGHGDWPSEIKDKLGDGEHLKPLKFQGPYLIRKINGIIEPLFPAPLNIIGKEPSFDEVNWTFSYLNPGNGIDCDLGNEVKLPAATNGTGMKRLNGFFFNKDDMQTILQGNELQHINPIRGKRVSRFVQDYDTAPSPINILWDLEYTVGIERNYQKRTAKEGAIYSSQKVRLCQNVALAMNASGLTEDLELPATLTFGGESRIAYAEKLENPIGIPEAPPLQSSGGVTRFTVTHLTPAYFERGLAGPGEEFYGIHGTKVISACLERPVRIGGWNSIPARKGPIPLKPFIPPGSVWFCESEKEVAEKVRDLNGCHIGGYTDFGFGQILIGLWKEGA